MKKKKLRIGDKIRWNNSIGGDTVYTIMDIDPSRPTTTIFTTEYKNEILFQWEHWGTVSQNWSHSIDALNDLLNEGKIIIVERDIKPYKELLKFSL